MNIEYSYIFIAELNSVGVSENPELRGKLINLKEKGLRS